tara:strand:- start:5717 stop:6538 length:822 start_codon:yes stop_codon:yes gene_type:complete
MSSSKKDIINILSSWKNNFVSPSNWDHFKRKIDDSVFKILSGNNSFTNKKKKERSGGYSIPNFNNWIKEMEGNLKIKLIHIYYWNLLDEIEKKGKLILNLSKHQDVIKTNKLDTEKRVEDLKKENNEGERINSVNARMSKYYKSQIESSQGINKYLRYMFFMILSIIIIIFIAKKQYKNKKISFYIIFLFLITYSYEPIYFYILLNTRHLGEFFVNYFSLYFLFIMGGLFLGFKNFIFEENNNSKLYFYMLNGIIVISLFLIIYRYFTYSWNH